MSVTKRWVRTALALAVAGLVALLSGGILLAVGGSAAADECVPEDAWTETTDWVLESPGEGWYEIDSREVVDEEAYDEVVGWTNYTWNPGNTVWDEDDPLGPPWPHPRWSPNQGDHSGHPQPGDPEVNERGNYDRGRPGRSDWFHWEAQVEHHEAVTHMEFRYAFDHPAVVCEPDEPEPTDPTTTDPEPEDPETDEPEVLPEEAEDPEASDDPEVVAQETEEPEVLGAEAEVKTPSAVAAGSLGWSTTELWGAALSGGGLALLLSSGMVLFSVRKD